MTTIENSEAGQPAKKSWFRRAVMGATFAAAGLMSLGTAATPAQAYWYHYGPYYHSGWYHPAHYHWYGPRYYSYGYAPVYYGWGYGPRWHHWHHWYR